MALNLTDYWQMAKILTDNWDLYPPPPSRSSMSASFVSLLLQTCEKPSICRTRVKLLEDIHRNVSFPADQIVPSPKVQGVIFLIDF